jgi:hypothetical protein
MFIHNSTGTTTTQERTSKSYSQESIVTTSKYLHTHTRSVHNNKQTTKTCRTYFIQFIKKTFQVRASYFQE